METSKVLSLYNMTVSSTTREKLI